MKLKTSNLVFAFTAACALTGCADKEVKHTEVVSTIEFMAKSPYHLTYFQNYFGGDLIKLEGEFYTLVDAEGYVDQGSKVIVKKENHRVIEICQILSTELQEFSRCFATNHM